VRYHKYLQFLADRQLGEVASEACRGCMNIGLIRDLALGVDPDGADAWTYQSDFIDDLRCGAPRDDFNPEGQDWGVLPLNPLRLRSDHRTYAQLLRANMRHAGGLRIDHIIGIDRQFVVPRGGKPGQGCYVRFPTNELLSLIALESQRNKCMVIGEDLGTVPEGLRQRMHDARLFGCSVFYFERWDGGIFRAPSDYRKHTIASAGTHDLPTVAGYWTGRDIEAQTDAGVMSEALARDAKARRAEDKKHLLNALAHAGVLEQTQTGDEPTAETLRKAVHAYLAASAAQLFAAQIDDILDEITQLNLPGTVDKYPNWRRKLRIGLEDPDFKRALSELARTAKVRLVLPDRPA
jgi:4-alpha-glucanotransferase